MSNKFILIISISLLSGQSYLRGQENEELFTINTPVTVNLETSEDEIEPDIGRKKKKKVKRNTFYGVKTKKGFTRIGFKNAVTLELFYFLKEPRPVQTSVRDIYWYDYKQKMIRKGPNYNPKDGALLHGPYKKVQQNQVLDSGVYYMGTKHGTWLYHDRNDILVDKEKYFMGWPRESLVRYYDRDRKQMKEIIPVEFGVKEGFYYYFFGDGRMAVRGEYKWDKRVGDWTEYYPSGVRKKIVRYGKNPFAESNPLILREWNAKGREVYDHFKARR